LSVFCIVIAYCTLIIHITELSAWLVLVGLVIKTKSQTLTSCHKSELLHLVLVTAALESGRLPKNHNLYFMDIGWSLFDNFQTCCINIWLFHFIHICIILYDWELFSVRQLCYYLIPHFSKCCKLLSDKNLVFFSARCFYRLIELFTLFCISVVQ